MFDGYVLKHKDIDVASIELNSTGEIETASRIFDESRIPMGALAKDGLDEASLREWWRGRSIPSSREGLTEMLESLGLCFPQELLRKSLGLSLSDQYWACPEGLDLQWADVNFFDNDFSEDVGDMLFGKMGAGDPSLMSPDNTSDGALRKKWKIMGGRRILIKGGTAPYRAEPANEVLASRICKRLGIPHVRYDAMEIGGEMCCACEDFIDGDTELVSAWHLKKRMGRDSSISEYEAFVSMAEGMGVKDARLGTDMMIVLDFIICNTDRHYNNFGVVRDANSLEPLSMAPIYDSGTSMWCRELTEDIDPASDRIGSKPFRSRHSNQIRLVKDFSWLDLDALDGIEGEFAEILSRMSRPSRESEARGARLCAALSERIGILRGISGK
ncbi:MAG: HipA domain-containing protein [Candidatus Methanoplasma sp.]|nr:HipA domain-containing protein [Candidatus Methanoplasma sp.]